MRRPSVSAWRESDEAPVTMTPGYVKRRRMKHGSVHRSDPQSDGSRPKVSSRSSIEAQISPVSLMSPITSVHSLFSPVEPKSARKNFFKQERNKIKSILKSTRSLPNVKDGRSLFPFMRYTTVKGSSGGKRGSKRKKVRWADPLVQYVEPRHDANKARPRGVSHDSAREMKFAHHLSKARPRGGSSDSTREFKLSGSKDPTQQKKSEISNNLKSHESKASSIKDESRSDSKQTWRSGVVSRGPALHCSPLATQQKRLNASGNSSLSFSSSRFGSTRHRSNNSFTLGGSTGVDREKLNISIMGYPRKSLLRNKPHDGRRKCAQQVSINKTRRSSHRQSTPFSRHVVR